MTVQAKNDALEQAHAQMMSVRSMVAALNVDYDELGNLRSTRNELAQTVADLIEAESGDYADAQADLDAWDADNEERLLGLEELAGDVCEYDEAAQRIREDALSVEVRDDWRAVGDDSGDLTEFRIVLCTGGPHVQIRGELDGTMPARAWLEYQGWGTPMTERVNQPGDQDALLAYAREFWFGE